MREVCQLLGLYSQLLIYAPNDSLIMQKCKPRVEDENNPHLFHRWGEGEGFKGSEMKNGVKKIILYGIRKYQFYCITIHHHLSKLFDAKNEGV